MYAYSWKIVKRPEHETGGVDIFSLSLSYMPMILFIIQVGNLNIVWHHELTFKET